MIPSQFCVSVINELNDQSCVVELGSGNGRDSLYFASQGLVTVAMDLSKQAIASCQSHADERNIQHARFFQGDLTSINDVQNTVNEARKKTNK